MLPFWEMLIWLYPFKYSLMFSANKISYAGKDLCLVILRYVEIRFSGDYKCEIRSSP